MFESHFGLSGPPFQLSPDPGFYFESRGHARAMAYLKFGVAQREGFIVVTGEIGAGKTTLLNRILTEDHGKRYAVIVDEFGNNKAFKKNVELEYQRNGERYQFLKWGQGAFDNFSVVPPGTGICHQVNLEYLARGLCEKDGVCFFDSLVGTGNTRIATNLPAAPGKSTPTASPAASRPSRSRSATRPPRSSSTKAPSGTAASPPSWRPSRRRRR